MLNNVQETSYFSEEWWWNANSCFHFSMVPFSTVIDDKR